MNYTHLFECSFFHRWDRNEKHCKDNPIKYNHVLDIVNQQRIKRKVELQQEAVMFNFQAYDDTKVLNITGLCWITLPACPLIL